jgi:NTP pyrophosphatase (non-canonical NTP hydrolase)
MSLYDPELEVGSKLERVLIIVGSERKRQLALKADGRFKYTLSDDGMTDIERAACLMEEMGEVARAALNRTGLAVDEGDFSDKGLRKELAQIAALAVAWMERL